MYSNKTPVHVTRLQSTLSSSTAQVNRERATSKSSGLQNRRSKLSREEHLELFRLNEGSGEVIR